MANKMQLITELSNNIINEITNTPENWLSFLDTASNNYKYSFNEQILIYAQRPDATVCTDIDTWNKRLHRWIKKGSKGIALITNDNGIQGLRHIFDISDTYDKYGRNVYIWQVENGTENEIIETLENRFGELDNKNDLAEAIINSVTNLVEDNFQDYYSDFNSIVNNSYLEELDELNLELYFKNMMKNSISYMALKRCGIDPKEYFDIEDFRNIVNFNTPEVIARLGIATSDIAEVELHEIYTTVLDLKKSEKNISHTFVKNNNEEYHEIKDNKIERGNENERNNNIPPRGGLSNTRPNNARTGESTIRDIRKNENEIHKREQERSIYRTDDERNINTTPSGNRENSITKSGTDSQETSERQQSERTTESTGSNDMGWINEQLQKSSTRNSNAGTNLQLNLFANNISEEQQKELINDLEAEQSSVFSFTQEMIDSALSEGSHFENGKFRIYKQFMQSMSESENMTFLKIEYGIGGTSSIKDFSGIGMDYSSKGITLRNGYKDDSKEILLSWAKVEKRIKELIMADRYLTIDEVDKYLEWEKNEYENQKWMFERGQKDKASEETFDINNIDKNYKLKDGNYFHFHTNEEGYYYAIYDKFGIEQDGGLLEYSDNEENETLMSIRERLADFTGFEELANNNLEEISQEDIDYITSGQQLDDIAKDVEQVIINNTIDAVNELKETKEEPEEIEFKIGQIIYLESDRKYRVEA